MIAKAIGMAMMGAAAGCAQNLYPGNLFMSKLELGSRIHSDQHYSYSGGIGLNIPITGILAVRPNLGGTFFTNKFSRDEINSFDYGLELSLTESKSFPLSLSVLGTRELLYTWSSWSSLSRTRMYEAVYGHLRVGMDKYFRLGRTFGIIPGLSSWFLFSNDEIERVTGFSLTLKHLDGAFFTFAYRNLSVESREDLQHSLEASIGVVIRKSDSQN